MPYKDPEKKRQHGMDWIKKKRAKDPLLRAREAQWQREHRPQRRAACRRWRAKYPEKQSAFNAQWYKKNRRKILPGKRKYAMEYARKFRGRIRASYLKRNYGLTVKQYNFLKKKQRNRCAICKQPEIAKHKGKLRRLAVDHCHQTGKVRGLLCSLCNLGIGLLQHREDLLKAAVRFLKRSPFTIWRA